MYKIDKRGGGLYTLYKMYKIVRRRGEGGVQKSFSRKLPNLFLNFKTSVMNHPINKNLKFNNVKNISNCT